MQTLNETKNGKKVTYYADDHELDYFFDMYTSYSSHEEMLKDDVRTLAYRDAMYQNSHLFKDKVVLEVGCGTGIMCLFAAKAGAKRVIAIDMAKITEHAEKIIKDNGFENVITVVRSTVEELKVLPDGIEKVDIIISEWMGWCLFLEYMLESVIYARDKWLKPGGLLFPDKASFYIAAIENRQYKDESIDFWKNVHGFDMSSIREIALYDPVLQNIDPNKIVSNTLCLKKLDIYTVKPEDLQLNLPFELTFQRNDYVHAFIGYFYVEFTNGPKKVVLSTAPFDPPTHWKQTVFSIEQQMIVKQGEKITGTFTFLQNKRNKRDGDVEITFEFNGEHCQVKNTSNYLLKMA